MHPIGSQRAANSSLSSLLILLALIVAGAVIGSVLGGLILFAYKGSFVLDAGDLVTLRIFQAASSLGMFVLPTLFLARIERNVGEYLPQRSFPMILLLITLLLSVVSSGMIDLAGRLNQLLVLPEQLSAIEQWMQLKEDQMEVMTLLFLTDVSTGGLLFNLLVMAVIPAIGEELLFRAGLQTILLRWLKNPHTAIWISAIVFSAIHLQFYGFLPRVLLGALFGYLFFWSKNVWVPILAHFINNAGVILQTYFYQKQGNTLDKLDYMPQTEIYVYFISFVFTGGLLWFFWFKTRPSSFD